MEKQRKNERPVEIMNIVVHPGKGILQSGGFSLKAKPFNRLSLKEPSRKYTVFDTPCPAEEYASYLVSEIKTNGESIQKLALDGHVRCSSGTSFRKELAFAIRINSTYPVAAHEMLHQKTRNTVDSQQTAE